MKRSLLLIALFGFGRFASSQSTCDTLWYRFILKSEITCIIPSYFPYLDIEMEVAIGKKNAVVIGGGPMIPVNFPRFINGKTADERTGFVFTPSVKRYIDRSCAENNLKFISLDMLYRVADFNVFETMVHTKNDMHGQVFQDTIHIQHQAIGLTANFGQMLYFGNAGLEFTVGIGAEFMDHILSGMIDEGAAFEKKTIQPFWQKQEHIAFRLPTRIRLFYRF